MNRHQIKKKNRPLTPAEQAGMTSLLSGLKKLRQQAVTRGKADESTLFGFTYTEAKKYGFPVNTFTRAVKALELHGFIDIVEQGGLRGAGHTCSKYKLSKRWVTMGGLDWAIQANKDARSNAQQVAYI